MLPACCCPSECRHGAARRDGKGGHIHAQQRAARRPRDAIRLGERESQLAACRGLSSALCASPVLFARCQRCLVGYQQSGSIRPLLAPACRPSAATCCGLRPAALDPCAGSRSHACSAARIPVASGPLPAALPSFSPSSVLFLQTAICTLLPFSALLLPCPPSAFQPCLVMERLAVC